MPLAGPTGAVDLQLAALAQLAAGGVLRCILVRDTPWMISSSYLAHFSSYILLIIISNQSYYFITSMFYIISISQSSLVSLSVTPVTPVRPSTLIFLLLPTLCFVFPMLFGFSFFRFRPAL